MGLIDSAVSNFVTGNASAGTEAECNTDDSSMIWIRLPFNDQVATNAVRKQSRDLSHNIREVKKRTFACSARVVYM